MAQWMYKVHPLKYGQNPLVSEKEINYLSQEGWEVVAVFNNPGAVILFKKRADGSSVLPSEIEINQDDDPDDTPEKVTLVAPDEKQFQQKPQKSESSPPETAQSFYNKGSACLANGDLNAAIKNYDQAIAMDPKYVMAYIFRANAKLKLHSWESAIEDFNKALELRPKDLPCIINRGICRYEMGEYESAIQDFDEIIRHDTKNLLGHEYRGQCRRRLKKYDEALADFEKAIKIDHNDMDAYILRGDLKAEMNDLEGAIADYTFVIKKDSSDARAYYKRSKVRKLMGDDTEARKDMKKYKATCTKIIQTRVTDWGEELNPEDVQFDENDDVELVDNDRHSENS